MKKFCLFIGLTIIVALSTTYATELKPEYRRLIEAAKEARNNSYSPYSNFKVGAALLTEDGKIFTGANIENSAYSPCSCAERTAIVKAVSEGWLTKNGRRIVAICVVLPGEEAPPCGVCRQVIGEFGTPDVIMAPLDGPVVIKKFNELLPYAFTPDNLKGKESK